ncbi:hypothetical protein [Streptomyces sp. NPDC049881]|uniref:hypothetical protein n=1 Tax=Streptomyces sp. NPDC049881 TaxID=3155778 RepID=UPI003415DEF5
MARFRLAQERALRWMAIRDLSLRKLLYRNAQIAVVVVGCNWIPGLWVATPADAIGLFILPVGLIPLVLGVQRERDVRWLVWDWQEPAPSGNGPTAEWADVFRALYARERSGHLSEKKLARRRAAWEVTAVLALVINLALLGGDIFYGDYSSLTRCWFAAVHLTLAATAVCWLRKARRPVPEPDAPAPDGCDAVQG